MAQLGFARERNRPELGRDGLIEQAVSRVTAGEALDRNKGIDAARVVTGGTPA